MNAPKEIIISSSSEVALQLQVRAVSVNKFDKSVNRIIKRSVDIILGSLLMIVSFPLLVPIIAMIVVMDSPGPVFFLQKRTGRDRKSFKCIKFRTMVVNKDANRLQVQPGDKRITRSGHYLRKFYLDELPQLINVVRGEMSLVGPRPHMLRHNVEFARKIENYHDRHKIKPGMTGLAQLRGYHGMIRNEEALRNRISSDLEYIETWTLFGDIGIFFRTLYHVIVSLGWEKD